MDEELSSKSPCLPAVGLKASHIYRSVGQFPHLESWGGDGICITGLE